MEEQGGPKSPGAEEPDTSRVASTPYVAASTPRAHDAKPIDTAQQQVPETAEVVVGPRSGKVAPKEPPNPAPTAINADPKINFRFLDLYRFASLWEIMLLLLGLVMAAANGALFPCMALIFGEAISNFQPFDQDAVNNAALLYLGIAVLLFITDYGAYALFALTAERQMLKLREAGFKHMLHLHVAWYDAHDALQLSSRLTGDTIKIKEGMGQKLGDALKFTAQFVAGYVIGFIKGWDITLIMSCVLPLIVISLSWLIKTLRTRTERAQKVYAEASAVAEETLGAMRTIVSNNGERRAIDKYEAKALRAESENIQLAKFTAIVLGVFFASMWFMYAAGLWYGGKRVADNKTTPGSVFSAFFGVLIGSMAMAQISPNISAIAEARGAASALYRILATPSAINASIDNSGVSPSECQGEIEAIGLHFAYPSRPDAPILNGYNVKISSGQTVAFVGASGGGKSTLIALLERFYDPTEGTILLDGRDIKDLNVRWLRSQIGLVSQEPVLFAATIGENIAMGLASTTSDSSTVTQEQIETAAKLANAHDFIMRLPAKYNTMVGEKGISLSGGQKQRVAIARAIVREPKILVLDEATSALDAESERVVQAALNDLMDKTKMTTLVIAHRLSTVRRADKIVVLAQGCVVEEGTHDQLLKINGGVYKNLYTIQEGTESGEKNTDDVEPIGDNEGDQRDTRYTADSRLTNKLDVAASEASIIEGDGENDSATQSITKPFSLWRVIALCEPERRQFLMGCFGAAVVGCSMPGSAILISGMVSSMTEKYMLFQATRDLSHMDALYDEVQLYGALYAGGAGVLFIATALQQFSFKFIAEKLTSRLRLMHFSALCRQEIGFFDDSTKNATGALTASLATNATKVAMLSGEAQGRTVQAIFTFIAALLISFLLGSWLLSLVMLAVFPLLILGQVIRMQQMHKGGSHEDDALEDAGAHASQALSNMRTVVALGLERPLISKFTSLLEKPLRRGVKLAHTNGVAVGFSSFIMFAVYSLVFWYGGTLIKDDKITFQQLIRTLMAIMMSAQGIGSAASWLADTDKARAAGAAIFSLIDAPVFIDTFAPDSNGIKLDRVEGRIEFQDVMFKYPTRPEVIVLKHYSLVIEPGQTVAFCGASGGGKSTVIALLERFYDPIRGLILLDGHNLRDLNLSWLRSQFGLVGQEPTLFIGTIADNIAYSINSAKAVTQGQIEAAAKMANAHDFITRFPEGYQTQVGMKGEQLSGGQKQRIAIARAILKNPSVLLLDEATSALDSESEKNVQEALDKVVAIKRRTTLIIAHRLSTIRKADKICVVMGGRVAEQGSHLELIARTDGLYATLVATSHE